MLKDVESEDAIKTSISKRELVRVADDIGVLENLMLEFDACWVFLRGRTRADVKNNPIAFAQGLFEVSADWVGYVVGRNRNYVFLDEKRHFILDSVNDAAGFALQPVSRGTQFAVAGRTADKTGNALIHSTFHVLPHIAQTQTFSLRENVIGGQAHRLPGMLPPLIADGFSRRLTITCCWNQPPLGQRVALLAKGPSNQEGLPIQLKAIGVRKERSSS